MKLTITIVLLAIATTHLIFAEDPDVHDTGEKEQDQSLFQPINPIQDEKTLSIGLPNIAQSIKPFSKNKQLKKIKWSKGMLSKAVKSLGIQKIPGLKLVKVRKTLVRKLKKAKSHMVKIRTGRRVTTFDSGSIHSNEQDTKSRKRSLHDLCEEFVDDIYVLAHADERLAYKVETVRCEGVCTYQGIGLGECVLKTKTMIVYVIDSSNELQSKTVNAGCACECLTYSL